MLVISAYTKTALNHESRIKHVACMCRYAYDVRVIVNDFCFAHTYKNPTIFN